MRTTGRPLARNVTVAVALSGREDAVMIIRGRCVFVFEMPVVSCVRPQHFHGVVLQTVAKRDCEDLVFGGHVTDV